MTVEVDAPAGLEPRVDEGPGAIRISAVQPNGAMDRTVRTKIAARVPAAATFDAVKLRDGRLTIDGLSGAITADVRHGGIRASRVRGRVRLETLRRRHGRIGDARRRWLTAAARVQRRRPADVRADTSRRAHPRADLPAGRFSRTFRSRGGRPSARASARRRWEKGAGRINRRDHRRHRHCFRRRASSMSRSIR